MGKILQVLKGIELPAETKFEIQRLDRRLADLEQQAHEHKAVVERYAALEESAAKRKMPEPYDPRQGTGTPPPKIIVSPSLTARRRK